MSVTLPNQEGSGIAYVEVNKCQLLTFQKANFGIGKLFQLHFNAGYKLFFSVWQHQKNMCVQLIYIQQFPFSFSAQSLLKKIGDRGAIFFLKGKRNKMAIEDEYTDRNLLAAGGGGAGKPEGPALQTSTGWRRSKNVET